MRDTTLATARQCTQEPAPLLLGILHIRHRHGSSLLPQMPGRWLLPPLPSENTRVSVPVPPDSLCHLLHIQYLKQQQLTNRVLPANELRKTHVFLFKKAGSVLSQNSSVKDFLGSRRYLGTQIDREREKKTHVHSTIRIQILVGRYSTHYGASLLSLQLSPSCVVKGVHVLLKNPLLYTRAVGLVMKHLACPIATSSAI